MARMVYVNGFGGGRAIAERTGEAIAHYAEYDDVDSFTFSYATKNPDVIARAVKGVDTWTHSAGLLAVEHTDPSQLDAIGAPLPASPYRLVGRACLKTLRLHMPGIGIHKLEDLSNLCTYDASTLAELTVHPIANIRQIPRIGRFNAISAAKAAIQADIPTTLHYNRQDEFFRPSVHDLIQAVQGKVDLRFSEGVHDELLIRPASLLAAHLKRD